LSKPESINSAAASRASALSGEVSTNIGRFGTPSRLFGRRARTANQAPGMCPRSYSRLGARSTTLASPFASIASSSAGAIASTGAASISGMEVTAVPFTSGRPASPPSSTKTSGQPIWTSHEPVITARTPSPSISTKRALRVAM
jgi:hypothetical protein